MIRAVLLEFWGELNTPESYHADPYGGLVNQLGHVALGAFIAAATALIYCAIFGEMPYRLPLWFSVSLGYLVLIEWLQQGWNGADSVIDGGFVSLGMATPLVSLHEVTFTPHVQLEPQINSGLTILGCIVVALTLYVFPRAVRKYRGQT